jgi:hypothetical protein
MFIKASGLHRGDRLRKCCDRSRLWWPYLFLSANGYGRMRLDYDRYLSDVAVGFKVPLSENQYWATFEEYRANHLAFLYSFGDEFWCQWHCAPGSLPQYQTKEDNDSPPPPRDEFDAWIKSYVKRTKPLPANFKNLPKSSLEPDKNFPIGIGGGIGSGEVREKERPAPPPPLTPQEFQSPDVFESWCETFNGPIEDSARQMFVTQANTPELMKALLDNTPLWLQAKAYSDGFCGATRFLKSGVWKKPPRPEVVNGAKYNPPEKQPSKLEERLSRL